MGLLLLQVCLQGMLQVDDCEGTNHECWADDANLQTACKDTFRGYICQCPPGGLSARSHVLMTAHSWPLSMQWAISFYPWTNEYAGQQLCQGPARTLSRATSDSAQLLPVQGLCRDTSRTTAREVSHQVKV